MKFMDRKDAGKKLAQAVTKYQDHRPLVLGIPYGGILVAKEVADLLKVPLEIIGVKKVTVPDFPEFVLGAITEDGVCLVNDGAVQQLAIDQFIFDELVRNEKASLENQLSLYRSGKVPLSIRGRVVLIVDDGLEKGMTAKAAIEYVRRQGASKVVLLVPIGSAEAVLELRGLADEVICLSQATPMMSLDLWYDDNSDVDDSSIFEALNPDSGRSLLEKRVGRASPPKHRSTYRIESWL